MLSKFATRTDVDNVWSQNGIDFAGSASHGIQFGAGGPGGGGGGDGGGDGPGCGGAGGAVPGNQVWTGRRSQKM